MGRVFGASWRRILPNKLKHLFLPHVPPRRQSNYAPELLPLKAYLALPSFSPSPDPMGGH
jgi:hypothetical protein